MKSSLRRQNDLCLSNFDNRVFYIRSVRRWSSKLMIILLYCQPRCPNIPGMLMRDFLSAWLAPFNPKSRFDHAMSLWGLDPALSKGTPSPPNYNRVTTFVLRTSNPADGVQQLDNYYDRFVIISPINDDHLTICSGALWFCRSGPLNWPRDLILVHELLEHRKPWYPWTCSYLVVVRRT